MIRIGKPVIEKGRNDTVVFKSFIHNDLTGGEWLWYETDVANGEYFTQEVTDAFVLPMLLPAVKSHQNIIVESSMSEKLFYNLNDSVLYAVSKAYEKKTGKHVDKPIKIECNNLVSTDFKPTAVGTGCSLGVDSFTVLKHHFFSDDCPQSYKITHLTLFNAGAFGSVDVEGARRSFKREVEKTKGFANSINLPFIWVDSNVRSLSKEPSFNVCHTFLNMGIVLSMQKLWKKYLYASGYSVDFFSFDIDYSARYEPFLLPHLSTESTELVSASMNMKRSEKVNYISSDPIVQEKLYVCLKEQELNNPYKKQKYHGQYLNCGQCMKCLRTMLQLDILGVLNNFKDIFDFGEWEMRKGDYIAEVIVDHNKNLMLKDLYDSMIEHNYPIPKYSKRRAKAIYIKRKISVLLKK